MSRYYIVPAEIIETNFTDDLNVLLQSSCIIETNKTPQEVADAFIEASID